MRVHAVIWIMKVDGCEQEKLRQRLQEEMEKMCTFKPAVNPEGRVRDPTPVRSRYLDGAS